LRSNAHAVSPVFAKEFKEFWVAPPSAGFGEGGSSQRFLWL